MSQDLNLARKAAWHLCKTLMVPVVLFEADGGFGVMEASEYDGDEMAIVQEYDPHSR